MTASALATILSCSRSARESAHPPHSTANGYSHKIKRVSSHFCEDNVLIIDRNDCLNYLPTSESCTLGVGVLVVFLLSWFISVLQKGLPCPSSACSTPAQELSVAVSPCQATVGEAGTGKHQQPPPPPHAHTHTHTGAHNCSNRKKKSQYNCIFLIWNRLNPSDLCSTFTWTKQICLSLCPLLQKIGRIISTWGRHCRWSCWVIFSADKWEYTPLHTLCSSVTRVRQVVLDSQHVCPLHSSMCWHPPLPYFCRPHSVADGICCSVKLNPPLHSSTVGKHFHFPTFKSYKLKVTIPRQLISSFFTFHLFRLLKCENVLIFSVLHIRKN